MTDFTPGPWEFEYDNDGNGCYREWFNILACNKQAGIAEVYRGYQEATEQIVEANARLIAAAPAMYEALKIAEKALDALSSDWPVFTLVKGRRAVAVALALVEKETI